MALEGVTSGLHSGVIVTVSRDCFLGREMKRGRKGHGKDGKEKSVTV